MKLFEEGKIDLKKNLSHYLKWVKGSDKEFLKIDDLLLHQAGLVAFIPFYKETLDNNGNPNASLYFRKDVRKWLAGVCSIVGFV